MKRAKDDRRREEDLGCAETLFALPRPSRRLTALTSSALALPGIAGSASADAPIERAEAAASFSYYREDDISENKFFDDGSGDRDRYEVYTTQLRFDLPVAERIDAGVQFLYEDMSGASPWFVVVPGPTDDRLQVMSGATIEDERIDLTLDADFFQENGKDTIAWGFSDEKDYFSTHFSLGAERHFNDKNTTFSTSGAFSYDWIDPTDPGFSLARPSSGEKWSIEIFTGLSQILSRSTTGQITINYKHSDGYLGDPYKAIQNVDGANGLLSDRRPGHKDQASFLGRLRQHVEAANASAHIDYRFYVDSFDVTSHTVDLAWYQTVTNWLTIIPSVRYYSQSKADFYDTVLPIGVIPSERSSDFRLSAYGALSFRLKAEFLLEDLARYEAPNWLQRVGVSEGLDLIASLSYERYLSDGDYALVSVDERDEAPGLVKFHVFAVNITGRF